LRFPFREPQCTAQPLRRTSRLKEHQNGAGSFYTKKRLPVELVYFEEFSCIDEAFNREKQVQGWSRKKKKALINGGLEDLPELAIAYRDRSLREPLRPDTGH